MIHRLRIKSMRGVKGFYYQQRTFLSLHRVHVTIILSTTWLILPKNKQTVTVLQFLSFAFLILRIPVDILALSMFHVGMKKKLGVDYSLFHKKI